MNKKKYYLKNNFKVLGTDKNNNSEDKINILQKKTTLTPNLILLLTYFLTKMDRYLKRMGFK